MFRWFPLFFFAVVSNYTDLPSCLLILCHHCPFFHCVAFSLLSHKVKSVRYQFKCLTILSKVSNGIEKVNIVIPESFLSVQQSFSFLVRL